MKGLTAINATSRRLVSLTVTLCIALLMWHQTLAHASEQVVSVPLADNGSIAYLLTQKDGSQPTWILVMLPGETAQWSSHKRLMVRSACG